MTELEQIPKYHSLTAHNYLIRRNGSCKYCEAGSTPRHETLIRWDKP